ncbi:MAG: hypothetical protein H6747_14890 [Deltaproteobacteria bacterium]|nr:hypothetical protein [Deltaproteobacteria bacterium]
MAAGPILDNRPVKKNFLDRSEFFPTDPGGLWMEAEKTAEIREKRSRESGGVGGQAGTVGETTG